jgi:hypothetical protein
VVHKIFRLISATLKAHNETIVSQCRSPLWSRARHEGVKAGRRLTQQTHSGDGATARSRYERLAAIKGTLFKDVWFRSQSRPFAFSRKVANVELPRSIASFWAAYRKFEIDRIPV